MNDIVNLIRTVTTMDKPYDYFEYIATIVDDLTEQELLNLIKRTDEELNY